MAESDAQTVPIENQEQEQEQQVKKLKYLEFIQAAVIHAVLCASSLYQYAKENAGPLKPGVQAAEGTVRTVVGPVVDKFHDVPFELLNFVDRKVDESVHELEQHVPPRVKEASTQAYTMVQKVPEVARSAAEEIRRAGVVGTAAGLARAAFAKYKPVANDLYAKYEPEAERCAVATWQSLNRLPLFPQVAHVLVPTAAQWSEKYNQVVFYTAEHDYAVSAYMPLIPTEKIAKVFSSGVPVEASAAAE